MNDDWFDLPTGNGMAGFDAPDQRDPLDAALATSNNGVDLAREGRELLTGGDARAALDRLRQAQRAGLPAEVLPHVLLLTAVALLACDEAAAATPLLEDAWRDHPDFSALPAALGAAYFASARHDAAARTLFAALINEDPDATLARYRPLIARSLRRFSKR